MGAESYTNPVLVVVGAGSLTMLALFFRAYFFADRTTSRERKDLTERVTELRLERAALEAELASARAQKYASDSKASVASAEADGLKISLAHSRDLVLELRASIREKDEEIASLEAEIAGLTGKAVK